MKVKMLLLISFLFLVGCTFLPKSTEILSKDEIFKLQFQHIEFNKDFQIIFFPDKNMPLQIGTSFFVLLKQESKNVIKFDLNKDVKILWFKDNKWISVENNVDYLDNSNIIEIKNDNRNNVATASLLPALINEGNRVDIRIVIIGQTNGFIFPKKTGAFIDLTLSP